MYCVYTTSDSYAEITGISILSLFENNKEANEIVVFVIDNNISDKNKQNMMSIAKQYNRLLTFLKKPNIFESLDFEMNVGRWHISTFYRLFMGKVLPIEIEKAFYIDSDTIIRHSLVGLYDLNLGDCIVAGADDFRSNNYRTNIGLEPNDTYINNGFLLLNLKKWREEKVEDEFLKFIIKYKGDITYMDQGVLNGVIGKMKKVHVLPPKYNSQTVFHDFTYNELLRLRRPEQHAAENEILEAKTDPVVVHFTSCFMSGTRPWMKKNNHPYTTEYLKYKSISPWKDTPLLNDDRKLRKKMFTFFSRHTPKFLLFPLISITHAVLYPMIRNIKQIK